MPHAARQVIRQQSPPYEDPALKQLYLEAKAQDWMVRILAALNQNKTGKLKKSILTQKDRARGYEAEERLLVSLSHPPSLADLANAVGTNEKKLNEIFKAVFGSTVFAWLREQRLQKAMELLEIGQLSLQQVAKYCGYKYQPDSSKAFKQRFGVPPRSV